MKGPTVDSISPNRGCCQKLQQRVHLARETQKNRNSDPHRGRCCEREDEIHQHHQHSGCGGVPVRAASPSLQSPAAKKTAFAWLVPGMHALQRRAGPGGWERSPAHLLRLPRVLLTPR